MNSWPDIFCWGRRLHLTQRPFTLRGARHRTHAVEWYPVASVDISGYALLTCVCGLYVHQV